VGSIPNASSCSARTPSGQAERGPTRSSTGRAQPLPSGHEVDAGPRGAGQGLSDLFALLRIPSISAEPEHEADVRQAAERVLSLLRSAGG
jgi:hypothetical protein